MKKSTLILAIFSTFTGVASAASGVTLYGKVEAAYQGSNTSYTPHYTSCSTPINFSTCMLIYNIMVAPTPQIHFKQGSEGESRLGIKGNEDLGNGMSAFFQLEGKINSDTGAIGGDEFFSEKSIMGLSFGNGKHSVYFGRSDSPLNRIDLSTNHLSSYMNWKSSQDNWKNAAFYDYSANGLSIMAAFTTKGGSTSTTLEGESGTKPTFGLSAKYSGSNYAIAAGYQRENGNVNGNIVKSEWGVGAQYTFNPLTASIAYANAKLNYSSKEKRISSTISAKLSPRDTLFINFLRDKTTEAKYLEDLGYYKTITHFGLGYIHAMSKRTELFVNIGRDKTKAGILGNVLSSSIDPTRTAYDFGLRHSF